MLTPNGVATVLILLFDSRPSAVFWAVILAAINPVKRAPIWSFAHISQKQLKRFPALAVANSFAPVIWEAGVFDVVAAELHASPSFVCGALAVASVTVHPMVTSLVHVNQANWFAVCGSSRSPHLQLGYP